MSTATATQEKKTLPPFQAMTQRDFLVGFGPLLVDEVGKRMQPVYAGPQDASCPSATAAQLKRPPLGAQGFIVEALATGRNGRKPRQGEGAVRPSRGQLLVGEMASGKTFMSLLFLELSDRLASRVSSSAWEAYRQDAYPAVVLVPVTLLEKFAREAVDTIPDIKPVIVLPIRKSAGRLEEAVEEEEEAQEEGEQDTQEIGVDAEASLRAFDPNYQGGNLSAVGVLNRVVRRIRSELASWEEECHTRLEAWRKACKVQRDAWRAERQRIVVEWRAACEEAKLLQGELPSHPALPDRPPMPPQPALPAKPKHLVILSQSVAKLGSAWKPAYVMRPLIRVDASSQKRSAQRDQEGNPRMMPACPRCGGYLSVSVKRGRDGQEEIIYLTEQDLLAKKPAERFQRRCQNRVRQWSPEQHKWRLVPCREPLWQIIPATIPPKLQPQEERGHDERRKALPLPGTVQQFSRRLPVPTEAERQAARADESARHLAAYQAEAWQWSDSPHLPHPPCVVDTSNRRYPLAEYILEHYRTLFRTAIVDEVHQYSGAGTAQGYAAQALVDSSDSVLGMTGTLFGGYARALFHLLRRISPEFRRKFGPRELQRFVRLYGVQQLTYKERFDQEGKPIGAVSKRRQEPEPKDLPGTSPLVMEFLFPIMATVQLLDVWLNPTAYTEEVVLVDMGPVIGPNYDQLQRTSTQMLRQLLAQGDRRAVSAWFHGLLRYPNMPWQGMEIVHPAKKLVLGSAPKTPEEFITPKERKLLQLVRKERAEGRRVLLYAQSTNKHDIQPRLERLIKEDDRRWRMGLPVLGSEGELALDDSPLYPAHLSAVRVRILRSGSPPATKREAWLRQVVKEGVDVLICHSKLVEVGLDLLAFPTIIAYEIIFSTTSMRQAFRRSWRPGQNREVRVYILCFKYDQLGAGTMESRGLDLIARKAAVSMMLEGKLPPAESMARQVMAKGGASDPMLELAFAMVDANGPEALQVEGSIEATFKAMNSAAPTVVAASPASLPAEPEGGNPAPAPAPSQADQETHLQVPAVSSAPGALVPLFASPHGALHAGSVARQPREAALERRDQHRVAPQTPGSAQPAQAAASSPDPRKAEKPVVSRSSLEFGKLPDKPERQRQPKPVAPSRSASTPGAPAASLWATWGDDQSPKQEDLLAPAAQPTGPLMLEDQGAREAEALSRGWAMPALEASEVLPHLVDACVCGKAVEFYGPDGRAYCATHAPIGLSQLPGASQQQKEPVEPAPASILSGTPTTPQEQAASQPVGPLSPYRQIVVALQHLAGVCDGARTKDGQGFNGSHTVFGKSLALQSTQRTLTPKQLKVAMEILLFYRRQLSDAKLTLPTAQQFQQWLKESTEQTPGDGTITLKGEQVIVRFKSFDQGKVRQVKALYARFGGRGFDGSTRSWVLSRKAAQAVLEAFPELLGAEEVAAEIGPQTPPPSKVVALPTQAASAQPAADPLAEQVEAVTRLYRLVFDKEPNREAMCQKIHSEADAQHWLKQLRLHQQRKELAS